MSPVFPQSTLLPQQTRMIDARSGFRLEVLEGCLWVTRPGDALDRFVRCGSSLELHERHVLVQSEAPATRQPVGCARYRLVPLAQEVGKSTPASRRSQAPHSPQPNVLPRPRVV